MLAQTQVPDYATTTDATLQGLLQRQREGFLRDGPPSYAQRRAALKSLLAAVLARQEVLAVAVSADFGNRSRHETLLAEIYTISAGIRHNLRHLRGWMRPRRVPVPLDFQPGRARVIRQPLGVVGIISPWNYPVQLAILPLVGALAAGNRVLIKPSEITPRTSQALADLLGSVFPPDQVAVVQGGRDVGEAFSRLPLDHLLYTGSTAVGRKVMQAAAANLTPVTLELGGKSPVLIGPDARMRPAADSIVAGKLLNAGQTCIAPDYVLVPEGRREEFVAQARQAAAHFYPTVQDNPDYTSIVNDRHWQRLTGYLDEARKRGSQVVDAGPAGEQPSAATRKLPLHLILDPREELGAMREEIFGPVLPVLTYRNLDEAIAYVNGRPRPLALYYFGEDRADRNRVLSRVVAGGVCVNETLYHVALEGLPFGGVGESGMGAYHGQAGFDTFTKQTPVFLQSRLNAANLIRPPYGKLFGMVMKTLVRG
jgi:acyl-CoA reductase-like NAD-dependent aldehyde dehydrogenase